MTPSRVEVPVQAVDNDGWVRREVSNWELVQVEPAGSTTASWLAEPDTEVRWLHKHTNTPVSTGVEQGEDWAEVIATSVASFLGVPRAETALCMRDGLRGSLSRNVRPAEYDLIDGGVVLETAGAPGYFPTFEGAAGRDPRRPGVRRPGHSLANIHHVLARVAPPHAFIGPKDATGFDVFAGYLVLDALIANRDRHEQNWAVLTPRLLDEVERLAPSYDHGGCLGYNLSDAERVRHIGDRSSLLAWAAKGTAHRFEHDAGKPQTLVSMAADAVSMCTESGSQWWRARLAAVNLGELHSRLARGVSGMSEQAATFASMLLDLNLGRLQDAICDGS